MLFKEKEKNPKIQNVMTHGTENWVVNKKNKNKMSATEIEYW